MSKHRTNPAFILAGKAEIRLKMSPGYNAGCERFEFGSCEGLVILTPSSYEIVVVTNNRPGNGTFAKFMDHLTALAKQHKRDIWVMEIHNPTLGPHLARAYGFTLFPDSRNAFLYVAGPAIVPPEYTKAKPRTPVDGLLDRLVSAFDSRR
jgi:hypothetical protein